MDGDDPALRSTLEDSVRYGPPRFVQIDATTANAKLMLREADDEPGARLLIQSARTVGALMTGADGNWLETADGSFSITRPRATWRGWRLEFVRRGAEFAALSFRPAVLRPGGDFTAGAGQCYKLRYPVFGASWHLRKAERGEPIATIRTDKSRLEYEIDLEHAAALVDSLSPLLLASCWVVTRVPWGGWGGGDGGGVIGA